VGQQVIQVEERLNEKTALQLAADLTLLQLPDEVLLDFSQTTHYEPFGMLLVSSAVNRLRARAEALRARVTVSPANVDPEGIAAHMGFWRSMGLPIGREIGAKPGKSSYLPITRLEVANLFRDSAGGDPLASGVISEKAKELAVVLAQSAPAALLEALTWSFVELIRNVVEHAMTPTIWIAGMSWPKRNYVQVAVLDEGRGIRRSLADNPRFRYSSDLEAIRASLQPDVSRNLGREMGREQQEKAAEGKHAPPGIRLLNNAGYGLYMISTLCREAGQFLIASGNAALAYVGSGEIQSATGHPGTALRLVLQPSEVPAAWEGLWIGNTARGPATRQPLLSPSQLRHLGLDSLLGGNKSGE
jgi:predicted NBD/HSP70 family sugar kinase